MNENKEIILCNSYSACSQNKNCSPSNIRADFKNKPACFCPKHRKILVESADWNDMGGHSLEELADELSYLIEKYKKQDHHIIVEESCIDIYCYENEL